GPGPAAATMGPDLLQFLAENPAFIPAGQTLQQVKAAARSNFGELMYDAVSDTTGPSAKRGGPLQSYAACNYAAGLKHQMAMANLAVTATGKKIPERLIGEVIKEVVSHEVGHTLGLRHNFKASCWLTLDEIKHRRDTTDDATFGSVMDYNPVLFFAGD